MPVLYLVSGLPASGKTRLARALAGRLAIPLFDKDDILEALFDGIAPENGESGLARRQRLSRASDRVLQTLVTTRFDAVVVSFWRHPTDTGSSGTPTTWLTEAMRPGARLIEIYCDCPPELARYRFNNRTRHPGHCDDVRGGRGIGGGNSNDPTGILDFDRYAARGPLGIGHCLRVDTTGEVDLDRLIIDVKEAGWKSRG